MKLAKAIILNYVKNAKIAIFRCFKNHLKLSYSYKNCYRVSCANFQAILKISRLKLLRLFVGDTVKKP